MSAPYKALTARFARIAALKGAGAILHWDSAVCMPENSAPVRSEQLAVLAEIVHAQVTAPDLAELLDASEQNAASLSEWEQANLREMRRLWRHENAVPSDLVGAFSRAATASEHCWRSARAADDFGAFAPHLAKVLSLLREVAQAKAEALDCSPYDALLDGYDPGMRSAEIDAWFADLSSFLPGFRAQAMERQAREQPRLITGNYPTEMQRRLGEDFMRRFGFDFTRGRADTSHHPFCGGVPGDIRLTTRYSETNPLEALQGVFHETGHALYEMDLPEEWRGQPVGEARGMSMHESQSLFSEMQICRSRAFLQYAAPLMREALHGDEAWEADNLFLLLTRVTPSLIRVNADEVTYPSHIILRYRLEKALLSGELPVAELPSAWNGGMKELLGVTPPSNADGCMQDIHWSDGSIGYFPTYTVGAMIAAQLFDAARSALPEVAEHLRRGEFAPLFGWLREHVHALASRYSTQDTLRHATGKPLDPAIYKAHLTRRYLERA